MSFDESNAKKEARRLLKEMGLSRTEFREKLVEALLSGHGPYTIEQLMEKIGNARFDKVSAYRSLAAFEKVGLVTKCEFGDGVSRYEMQSGRRHHHHVVCTVCKKVSLIEDCGAPKQVSILEQIGYKNVTHSMEFFGICPSCQNED